jgi:hypothetical protein
MKQYSGSSLSCGGEDNMTSGFFTNPFGSSVSSRATSSRIFAGSETTIALEKHFVI